MGSSAILYFGFQYYTLNSMQKNYKDYVEKEGGKVNWSQKHIMFNSVHSEVSYNGSTFLVKMSPAYFSNTYKYSVEKDAIAFVSSFLPSEIKIDFDSIDGTFNKNIIKYTIHNLSITDYPIILGETPLLINATAKKQSISIQWDADNSQNSKILAFETNDLNINDSLSLEKIQYNTEASTKTETNIRFMIKDFKNHDSIVLSNVCLPILNLSNQAAGTFCDKEALLQAFPINIDLIANIDNAIFMGEPTTGSGKIKVNANSPYALLEQEYLLNQSTEEITLDINSTTRITNVEKYKKLLDLIDPENITDHTLQNESLNLHAKTNPYTIDPIQLSAELLSQYSESNLSSTLNLIRYNDKNYYHKINGKFIESLPDKIAESDLETSGTVKISHPQLISILKELFQIELTEQVNTIEIYTEKSS